MAPDAGALAERPAELLQRLIRFDTTNPPGNEAECVGYVDSLLREAGFATEVLTRDPFRPNLLTRLEGRGEAPPLLLYGHVDVVTTAGQDWSRPPFGGEIADGCVWGRGAMDMKGAVAMMLAALMRARAGGLVPAGDVVLAVLSDEEAGGDQGARFLVETHPDRFEGVRFALGEFGGATLHVAGRRFYPVQVAEKQVCWLRATLRGPGGHASRPLRGGAMAGLGRFLTALDRARLPVRVTPVARRRLAAMAKALPPPTSLLLRCLLLPPLAGPALRLMGGAAAGIEPWLRNTVAATIVRGGDKVNVLPAEVTVELDGRLLPGQTPDDLLRQIRTAVGEGVELEVTRQDPGPAEPDMGLFPLLAAVLEEADPGAIPIPMLLPAVTDGRHFARLGIQTYGFTPMKLPPDLDLMRTIHAADERIPVEAVDFGTRAIHRVLERYPALSSTGPLPSPWKPGGVAPMRESGFG